MTSIVITDVPPLLSQLLLVTMAISTLIFIIPMALKLYALHKRNDWPVEVISIRKYLFLCFVVPLILGISAGIFRLSIRGQFNEVVMVPSEEELILRHSLRFGELSVHPKQIQSLFIVSEDSVWNSTSTFYRIEIQLHDNKRYHSDRFRKKSDIEAHLTRLKQQVSSWNN